MSAKSAPQLLPVQYSRSATVQLRGTFFVLVLAGAVVAGAAGLRIPRADVQPVAATLAPEVVVEKVEPVEEPAAVAAPAPAPVAAEAPPVPNRRNYLLSEFLAKRYKVSRAVTLDLVTIAHAAGHQIGLDPLLIIAVMAVESRFNPIAESVVGAKGLMQVIPKYHAEKFREFGGAKSVFDPETNILVGSQIIKEYLNRTGSLNSALQMYVGSSTDTDASYIIKVMDEKQRLQQILRKPAPAKDVQASAAERFVLAFNTTTTP